MPAGQHRQEKCTGSAVNISCNFHVRQLAKDHFCRLHFIFISCFNNSYRSLKFDIERMKKSSHLNRLFYTSNDIDTSK